MVDIVIRIDPVEINRSAAVHAFALLSIVKKELVAPERSVRFLAFEPFKQLAAVESGCFVQSYQLILTGFYRLMLIAVLTSYLDKYLYGSTADDLGDLGDYLHYLPDGTANGGGGIAVIEIVIKLRGDFAELLFSFLHSAACEIKIVRQQLHKIIIGLPEHIHDRERFAGLLIHMTDTCKELFGKVAPTGELAGKYALLFFSSQKI